jgi:hypothetical protein
MDNMEDKKSGSVPEGLPPALAVDGQRTPALYRSWRIQAHDPAGQRGVVAETAGCAEMVRIENFYQGRCPQAVGLHDAAVILMVFTMQQFVDFGDESDDVLGGGLMHGDRGASRVETPADVGVAVHDIPEFIELLPSQQTVKLPWKAL